MGKEILVNVANRETRIAVLDDNQLVELRVEREEPVVGNIYKGRVENVLPGMDAAFVDIGLERNAFLYVADILPGYVDSGDDDSDAKAEEASEEADERADAQAAAEAALEAEAAAEEEDQAEEDDTPEEGAEDDLEAEDSEVEPEAPAQIAQPMAKTRRRPTASRKPMRGGRGGRRHAGIAELVSVRQELMVQVAKGPRGTKGSRVSTRMSMPGRYLVLMPDANNLGVSRKIDEAKERDRLKRIVERFRQPGFGIIVRTEAEGRQASDLYQDYQMLVETWQSVLGKAKTTPAPGLIHQDMSLIYTIIRDAFGSDVDRLVIDSPEDYAKAHEIIDRISPDLSDRIHLYDGEKPMFEHFKIEDDIERLLRRKVWLKSGGYLVIDQTEALTTIDVNTGKFTGSTGLSETILQTNVEATYEIARQLRLRDIGGMIILDFIDMDNQRDKKMVTDALVKALRNDRSRTKISSISPLGLIEMTRKRTRETVDIALTDTCPYCHGLGRISSAETVSMQVEREIRKMARAVASEAILVMAHPDVVANLIGAQGEDIEKLEHQVHRAVYVRAEPHWHIEKYEVEPGTMQRIEQTYPIPKRGQVVECAIVKSVLSIPPWAAAHITGGYQVDIVNGGKFLGQNIRVRLLSASRSVAVGEVMSRSGDKQGDKPGGNRPGREQRGPRQPAGVN
jgi:ribonuclease G